MRRAVRIALFVILALLGLIVLAAAALVIGTNTDPGRHVAERLVPRLTGGAVTVDGLSGRFPGRIRLARIQIREGGEAWAEIEELAVDWMPLALLRGEAHVERIAAARIRLLRLPAESRESGEPSQGVSLPLRVRVDDIDIGRIELSDAVAGGPAVVSAKGSLHVRSLNEGNIALDVRRLDAAGDYALSAQIGADAVTARLDVGEPDRGLLAGIAGLPALGPLAINARMEGPLSSATTHLALAAGPLRATLEGALDLVHRTGQIDAIADAPAMSPRDDLSWRSVHLDAHLRGSFDSPEGSGRLTVQDFATSDAAFAGLTTEFRGDAGTIEMHGAISGLRVNPLPPDTFASAPLEFRVDASPNAPTRRAEFSLSHPALGLNGHAELGRDIVGTIALTLPSLAPFAAIADVDAQGHAAMNADFSLGEQENRISAEGILNLTGGAGLPAEILGPTTKMSLSAVARGSDISIDRATLEGQALHVELVGSQKDKLLDANATVAVSDLSRLAPGLAGNVTVQGHVRGPVDDFAVDAQAQGEIAPRGQAKGPFSANMRAEGLPNFPSGRIDAEGRLAESPLRLATSLSRDGGGTMHIVIEQAQWKSARARGELTLPPGAAIPVGNIDLQMARLEELEPFVGRAVTGSLTASVNTVQAQGKAQSNVRLEGQRLGLDGNSVERLSLGGRIGDPAGRPSLNLQMAATGINAAGVIGSATLDANGPLDSLALRLSSDLNTPKGPARIGATATARASKQQLQMNTLRADYGGETARLLAPAVLDFGKGLSIDRLQVGIRQAVLSAAGRISPTLDLTASVRNLDVGLAQIFAPDVQAQGTVTADAKLRGSPDAPEGSLRVAGRGLRLRGGSAGAMPAAEFDGTAEIGGELVRLDARITAGNAMRLRLAGAVPLSEGPSFDLNADGTLDFAVLDPLLTPQGRSARGTMALAAKVDGPLSAPRATGTARLANGSIQDFAQGMHVSDIAGLIEFAGDTVRIRQLTGKAGPGTISITGTAAPLAPAMPVDISVTARNARLLASDLVSASADADLTLKGDAGGELTLAGRTRVARADINIPDRLPQGVAVLEVRRPGQEPAASAASQGPTISLNLVIDAPEQIFVRGHGLDAELGGALDLRGTTAEPQVGRGFDLRRGTFSLGGRTLDFTSGKVTFDGAGLSGKINPALNFVARSTSGGVTAILTVTGHADSPKIQLSSSPELPQDEILAQLLFGRSVKQLSPLELAQIAQAIASLTGVGGGDDTLANVRKGLGLDRLSASGAGGDSNAAAVEAGKYVARGVYVGTKQGTSGGTQAKVQIDLTKQLKLESTVGTGGGVPATGATPDNNPGSSIGLSYEIEY